MTAYAEFLEVKAQAGSEYGFEPLAMPAHLFDFQQALVAWALRKGRAALFADCGLGKSPMQLAWAENVILKTRRPALILTPLAVAAQTVEEAAKFGVECAQSRDGTVHPWITVTNYERLHHFSPADFAGVVCDECFIAGTEVDTPQGPRPIESLAVDDCVIGALGRQRIRATAQRVARRLVVVYTKDRRYVCSPNHPWFTSRGWVAAQDLQCGDTPIPTAKAMRLVREALPQEIEPAAQGGAFLRKVLLSEMEDERSRSGGEMPHTPRRRRNGHDRVDRIEILESGDPGFARISGGADTVTLYDLEVEGHPSFSVGGLLVHNSSAIKSFDGQRRALVTDFMRKLPYRLLCTATAAPNDYVELGTSSEALGYLGHMDMLARFFTNRERTSRSIGGRWRARGGEEWRFKGYAEEPFWRWVASWARAMRRPSDLGFVDGRFQLPPLETREHVIAARAPREDMLFDMPAQGLREERDESRRTITERCEKAAELLANASPAVAWCQLNAEGDLLTELIDGAVQISGSDTAEEKEEALHAFSRGEIRVLVTKPVIGAWGLNWQHCNRMTFFPSHSYEQYYQAVRRCWRFGQQHPVVVDIVTTEGGANALRNLQRKAAQADRMFDSLVAHMNEALAIRRAESYEQEVSVPAWL